jgi:hypothetical protein
MRGKYTHRRVRRPLWLALAFAYALLLQSILGTAAASAHAFAMAQHEALGLGMLCLEDGRVTVADPSRTAPESQAPAEDCLSCKTACAAGCGTATLPLPEADPLYVISGFGQAGSWPIAISDRPLPARFASDLASRAPPTATI